MGVLPLGSSDFQLSEHWFPAASESDVKQFVDGSYLDILGVSHTSNSNHQDDGKFVYSVEAPYLTFDVLGHGGGQHPNYYRPVRILTLVAKSRPLA